jgi:hypothetical protein
VWREYEFSRDIDGGLKSVSYRLVHDGRDICREYIEWSSARGKSGREYELLWDRSIQYGRELYDSPKQSIDSNDSSDNGSYLSARDRDDLLWRCDTVIGKQ